MERDTVGKLSAELLRSDTRNDHSAHEQMQEQLSDFEKNLLECVDRGKTDFPDDFFVVIITKREKLMANVLRHYFFARLSCPTPHHDQTVYKYHRSEERIEFLWVVPDKEACKDLKENAVDIDPALKQLLQFVLDYYDGTLDKRTAALNGEIVV